MKTIVFYTFLICIVIGMMIPTFAISPDKNKGDKTKTEKLTPAPLPPTTWTLHIVCLDPMDTCWGLTHCGTHVGFDIHPATANCEGVLAVPPGFLAFNYGQVDYYQSIPDTIQCVVVTIDPGQCKPSYFSSNYCCVCSPGSTPCKLRICPP